MPWDFLCRGTFCAVGRLEMGRFVLLDVLSCVTFSAVGRLVMGRLVMGRF